MYHYAKSLRTGRFSSEYSQLEKILLASNFRKLSGDFRMGFINFTNLRTNTSHSINVIDPGLNFTPSRIILLSIPMKTSSRNRETHGVTVTCWHEFTHSHVQSLLRREIAQVYIIYRGSLAYKFFCGSISEVDAYICRVLSYHQSSKSKFDSRAISFVERRAKSRRTDGKF